MPELIHEVPSENELRAYLEEHFATSMLSPHRLSTEELSKSYPTEVARAFVSLTELDGQSFAKRAEEAIFTALAMNERATAQRPFWEGTNRRPTMYKVWTFCRMTRAGDPRNHAGLWAAAILPVWFGSNDFGQEAWLELSRLPEFDVRLPLYAALTIHLTANHTEDQASIFMREANTIREAAPILRRMVNEGDGLVVPWATHVLQLTAS